MGQKCCCLIAIIASAFFLIAQATMAETASDENLITLAHKKFTNSSSDEEKDAFDKFFQKTQDGEKVDLTPELTAVTDPRDLKILTDPLYAGLWKKDRVIKAEWLTWLCIDPKASAKVTSRGIEIAGARIEGKVDLAWAKIQFPLRTFRCAFTNEIILDRATVGSLQLQSTCIQDLNADNLTVERDISFVDGFRAAGQVWLRYATVNGTLACDNGHFINPGKIALNLEGAKTKSVFMRNGFEAEGQVDLYAAVISGTLDCDNGQFVNRSAIALNLEGLSSGEILMSNDFSADGEVSLVYAIIGNFVDCDNGHFINPGKIALDFEGAKTGSIFMRDGFEAHGEVKFYTAAISGTLQCDGGQFTNRGAIALNLESAKGSQILLWNSFRAEGEVRLLDAVVQGSVDCENGQFINPGAIALNMEGAKTGAVFLRNGFRAEGEVQLLNAVVEGNLDCNYGSFINSGAFALNMDGAKTSDVLLRNGFRAEGEVLLIRAVVQGTVDCQNGQFINPGTFALTMDGAKTGDVLLRNGFRAEGEVQLLDAVIDGTLECSSGHFNNPNGLAINATATHILKNVLLGEGLEVEGQLCFRNSQTDQAFRLREVVWHKDSSFDLRSAKVRTFLNDQKGWPEQDNLWLHGFTYDQLDAEAGLTARTQIGWVGRQPRRHFNAQPYEQTATVLRTMGLQEEAVKVMIGKNEDHGRHPHGFKEVIWYNILGPLIGFGYRPWNAFYASLVIILIGYVLFRAGREGGILTPTKSDAYDQKGHLSELYPKFNAFIYSLETFVPLLKLWMSDYWAPNANYANLFGLCVIRVPGLREFRRPLRINGPCLRVYLWCHIIVGWILTTLWVAGLTGLLKT